MRDSNVSCVSLTVWRTHDPKTGQKLCEPLTGQQIIDAFDRLTTHNSGPFKPFAVVWAPYFVERIRLERARILKGEGSYGYLLADKIDPCRPLLLNRATTYNSLILAVDSWGVNFRAKANDANFVVGVAKEAEQIATVIKAELDRISR